MVAKHSNIQAAALFFMVALGLYYLHIEYGFQMTKPMCAISGFILLKLWLRRVNTATYILFHVLIFGGAFLWLRHYLTAASSMDIIGIVQNAAAMVGK